MIRYPCMYCEDTVEWVDLKGWVHSSTGQAYVQHFDSQTGEMLDDHCAWPDRSGDYEPSDEERQHTERRMRNWRRGVMHNRSRRRNG